MPLLYEWEEPVSPRPSSSVVYPTHRGVEEYRKRGFSPSPDWTSFAIGLGIGLVIGLPIGREILKAGLRLTEREIRERIARV